MDKLTRQKVNVWAIIWLLFSLLLLIYTKYYIFIIMVPLLVAFLWCKYTGNRLCLLKYAGVLVLYILVGLNIHLIFPGYNMLEIIAQKQNDFIGLAKEMHSGSLLTQHLLQPDLLSMLRDAPFAFYNTLVRPYIFEADSFLILFSALENLMIFAIILLCIVFFRWRTPRLPVLFLCLFFFAGTYTLTGLTTPVMGAMVRYKVPAMPFLLIFFIMMLNKDKLCQKLPFFKKILG